LHFDANTNDYDPDLAGNKQRPPIGLIFLENVFKEEGRINTGLLQSTGGLKVPGDF